MVDFGIDSHKHRVSVGDEAVACCLHYFEVVRDVAGIEAVRDGLVGSAVLVVAIESDFVSDSAWMPFRLFDRLDRQGSEESSGVSRRVGREFRSEGLGPLLQDGLDGRSGGFL